MNLYSVFLMVANKTRSFCQNAKREPALHSNFCIIENRSLCTIFENKHSLHSFLCRFMNHWISFPNAGAAVPLVLDPRLIQTKRCNGAHKKNYVTYYMNSNRWTEKEINLQNNRNNINAKDPWVSLNKSSMDSHYCDKLMQKGRLLHLSSSH